MSRKTFIPLLAIVMAVAFVYFGVNKAAALNYTNQPMNDSTFLNDLTMTATQVQNFLLQEGSGLASYSDQLVCGYQNDPNFNLYNQYYDCAIPVTSNGVKVTNAAGYTEFETPGESAALIIAEASQAYGINPQVILATLQKEQSLITTPNPLSSQITYAMGYGCPDSGECGYPGFFNQVDNGTWQFRADFNLSSGENYWGYTPSDYPCNGASRYYSAALLAGNNVTFYDDQGTGYANFTLPNNSSATLYCYTPHVFPGSSAQYYSGNYWFVYYFSLWFGNSTAPYAFQSSSSGTVYLFVDGYKVAVPQMGMLQDFGVGPSSIQVLDPTTVANIPVPTVAANKISPTLGNIIASPSNTDADGANIYLVTAGQKHAFQTQAQFNAYGFNSTQVNTLPLDFIENIAGNTDMQNFIGTPDYSVFSVSNSQKNLIFTYNTYVSLDPSGSITPVSYYTAGLISSGNPISPTPVIVQSPGSQAAYIYLNNNYYAIETFDTLNCWGFPNTLKLPTFQPASSSYIAAITTQGQLASCIYSDGSGNNYLLSNTSYFTIPSALGFSGEPVLNSDLLNLMKQLPSSGTLNSYVKTNNSSSIYYVTSGGIDFIPPFSAYSLLGITPSQISTIDGSDLSSLTVIGVHLGNGQPITITGAAAVYDVVGSNLVQYPTYDSYVAYGNNWNNVVPYTQTMLNGSGYTYNSKAVGSYFYDTTNGNTYMVDVNGCYVMNTALLTDYGQVGSSIQTSYSYASNAFPGLNVSNCAIGSIYAQTPGQPVVYEISNGTKYPFSGWSSLIRQSGVDRPYIISVSNDVLGALPSGAPIQ